MDKSTRREFAFQCGGAAAAISLGQVLGVRKAQADTTQLQVSIDIMGLNALVHDRSARRAEVLFVNPLGLGMPKHTPYLVANMSDVTNPPTDSKPATVTVVPAAAGRGVQQLGLWDLTDTQVVVRAAGGIEVADGVGVNAGRDDGPISLPADPDDPEAWRDLRYVADMKRICGSGDITRGLTSLESSPGTAGTALVPEVIMGRIRFSGGVLEGAIPSWEESRRVVYQFSKGEGRPAVSQPLTDTIRWSLDLDAAVSGNYLTLDLVPMRGDSARGTRALMLAQRGRPCRLAISNLPADDLSATHHAISDEDMGALHFGAYYELLMHEPADRPLPREWRGQDPRRATGIRGTIFCPPAMFSRD